MRDVTLWTDGGASGSSSRSQPAAIGAGIVAACEGHTQEWAIPLGYGTSQQAELGAVIEALQLLTGRPNLCVTLVTDSRYIEGMLMFGWKPKYNFELVARARQLAAGCYRFRVVWVKGHAANENNRRADHLASVAAGKVSQS